jgi:hypothetical protein
MFGFASKIEHAAQLATCLVLKRLCAFSRSTKGGFTLLQYGMDVFYFFHFFNPSPRGENGTLSRRKRNPLNLTSHEPPACISSPKTRNKTFDKSVGRARRPPEEKIDDVLCGGTSVRVVVVHVHVFVATSVSSSSSSIVVSRNGAIGWTKTSGR